MCVPRLNATTMNSNLYAIVLMIMDINCILLIQSFGNFYAKIVTTLPPWSPMKIPNISIFLALFRI